MPDLLVQVASTSLATHIPIFSCCSWCLAQPAKEQPDRHYRLETTDRSRSDVDDTFCGRARPGRGSCKNPSSADEESGAAADTDFADNPSIVTNHHYAVQLAMTSCWTGASSTSVFPHFPAAEVSSRGLSARRSSRPGSFVWLRLQPVGTASCSMHLCLPPAYDCHRLL